MPDAIIEVREVDGWDFFFRGYTYYTFPAAGDDVICGELLSDESGFVRLRIPEGEYCAVIYSDVGVSNYIFSADPENEANNVSHEVVLESQNPADSYMVTMQFKQSGVAQLGNIEVCFRPGWNQSTGDCYSDVNGNSTFGLESYGLIRVNLPPGMYTAEIYRDGVLWGYSNIIPGFNYVYRIY